MEINSVNTIVFIGSGNVATHLAAAFTNTGRKILQIYSRNEKSAKELADKIKVPYTNSLNKIITDADLYIISITDEALPQIAKEFSDGKSLVVHTSGFHSMDVIKDISENIGVFYPLQTFSKNKEVDFLTIPVCIEANTTKNSSLLEYLARSFTTDVRLINSEQRKIIHIAAVFANNFTNHLYLVAEKLLKKVNVPFDILKPLIKETAEKAIELGPYKSQTGPAFRNDNVIMEEHLKMLIDNKDYNELYELISSMIVNNYTQK